MGYLETALAIWGDCDRGNDSPIALNSWKPTKKYELSPPPSSVGGPVRPAAGDPAWTTASPRSSSPATGGMRWPAGRTSAGHGGVSSSAELLEGQDDEPTAEDIRAADRMAYDLVRTEGVHRR